jgi:RimJ/RimL family protein N-acetyltransferase
LNRKGKVCITNVPEIRVLQPGDEAALEAFLLPRLESSMFLISNVRSAGLIDRGRPYEGTYAAAFEDGEVVAVVAHYWNQNLILQAAVHLDALWRAAVGASKRLIGGFIGPDEQVGAAKEALDVDESNVQLDEVAKLYSLKLTDLIIPDGLSTGRVSGRLIEPRDLELIIRWRIAFSGETLGENDGPQLRARSRSSIERSLEEQRTWVLEDHGVPVACSSFNAAIKEAVQVGGVWTPPELRRRGYGRCAVAVSLLDARSKGVEKAILFTGENNVAAQRAYEALGFRHIGDYRMVFFQSPLSAASRNR